MATTGNGISAKWSMQDYLIEKWYEHIMET